MTDKQKYFFGKNKILANEIKQKGQRAEMHNERNNNNENIWKLKS